MRSAISFALALLILGAAPAARGQAPNPELVLSVDTRGALITGVVFEIHAEIYRTGQIVVLGRNVAPESSPLAGISLLTGLATAEELAALAGTLRDIRIGFLEGDCGAPVPDYYLDHRVNWFGRDGRRNTFLFGAAPSGCPDEIGELMRAVNDLIEAVTERPTAIVIPKDAPLAIFLSI